MQRNSFSQKTISLLLSVLMVITMVPAFAFSAAAEELEATTATQISGNWQHVSKNGDGKGINYVSMGLENTNFVFMQTQANQKFRVDFDFWAFKNDGTNWARIDSTSLTGISFNNSYWTPVRNASGNPDGQELAGKFGSGYKAQMNNNKSEWSFTGEFVSEGSAEYNAQLDVVYTSASSDSFSDRAEHSLAAENDTVKIKITVVDITRAKTLIENANYMYENDSSLTEEEREELGRNLELANTYILDGSVVYTQDEIDYICSLFGDPVILDAVSGEWEHQIVEDGKYAGYGEEYVSMWVKNTEFVFMQTEDNQLMSFDFQYWAMKNNGVNTAIINTASFGGLDNDTFAYAWSPITDNAAETPNGFALPGIIGSGYSNQLAENLVKWNFNGTFTANGRAVYTPKFNVNYKSGSTGYTTVTNSFQSYNEIVDFKITVIDMRELLNKLDEAKDICENRDDYTAAEKKKISDTVNDIEANYVLDGSVLYSQETIDSLTSRLNASTSADFKAYDRALARAELVLESENYTDEQKATISALTAKKDQIHALTIHDQAQIDAATAELIDALNSLGSYKDLKEPNTSAPATFEYTASSGENDSVSVVLSNSVIYMDVSENFSDMGFKVTYGTKFGSTGGNNYTYTFRTVAPIIDTKAQTEKIGADNNLYNFGTYFDGVTTVTNQQKTDSKKGKQSYTTTYYLTTNYETELQVGGTPKIAPSNGQTATATVYIGAYWELYRNSSGWGSNAYTYSSNNTNNSCQFTAQNGQPHFTLKVYDKSQLEAAIDAAIAIEKKHPANYSQLKTLINTAADCYIEREVEQSEIDACTAALNSFILAYTVTATCEDTNGTTSVSLISGNAHGANTYDVGSVLQITATPGADYDFVSWSDGVTDATREYTVNGNADLVATFAPANADLEALKNLLADVPVIAPEDEYKYEPLNEGDPDTLEELREAVAAAEAIVNADPALTKSHQDEVDAAEQALRDAIDALTKTHPDLCDYTLLDEVIAASDALLDTLPNGTNDNRYKQDAWEEFMDAYNDAVNIDRTLTDDNKDNQQLIVDTALALAEALSALGEKENQNPKVDTELLETTVDEAEEIFEGCDDGRYKPEVWEEYEKAIEDAKELLDTVPEYDNDNGDYQKAVDEAVEKINEAIAKLNDPSNLNTPVDTSDLEEAIDNAKNDIGTDNSDGHYKEDLWSAYEEALAEAESVLENAPVYDDEFGTYQAKVDDAAAALNTARENLMSEDSLNTELVDLTELEEAKDTADTTYGDTNNGKYKDDAWIEYLEALENASNVLENAPVYDDDDHTYQAEVDAATERLNEAMDALKLPENQNYVITVTDENGDPTGDPILIGKDTETTFADIEDMLPTPTPTDDVHEFTGWHDGEGNEVTGDTPITDDITLIPTIETNYFILKDTAVAVVEKEGTVKYVGTEYYYKTVDELSNQFKASSDNYVVYRNGEILDKNDTVRTGDELQFVSKETGEVLDEATVVLYGDVNGDGAVDAFDALKVDVYYNTANATLTGAEAKAADMNVDGDVGTTDYSMIKAYVFCEGDIHRNSNKNV